MEKSWGNTPVCIPGLWIWASWVRRPRRSGIDGDGERRAGGWVGASGRDLPKSRQRRKNERQPSDFEKPRQTRSLHRAQARREFAINSAYLLRTNEPNQAEGRSVLSFLLPPKTTSDSGPTPFPGRVMLRAPIKVPTDEPSSTNTWLGKDRERASGQMLILLPLATLGDNLRLPRALSLSGPVVARSLEGTIVDCADGTDCAFGSESTLFALGGLGHGAGVLLTPAPRPSISHRCSHLHLHL